MELSVLTDSKVLALRDGVSFQPLGNADGAILLIVETGQLYTCNITTARVLSAVDGVRNFAQVVDEVSGDFEVSRDELHQDLSQIAEELVSEGLLK
jgi:hypothetical protein